MERGEAGRCAEEIAAIYLRLAGLELMERNLRVGQKEIDLLLRDGDCLVFAEVRLRRSDRCGSAAESVDGSKLRLMKAALREEIHRRGWAGPYRLDLLTLDFAGASRLVLEHFRGL